MAQSASAPDTAEHRRLAEDRTRTANWRRWGTYLSERQWGTVREDYSADGNAWSSFSHQDAIARAYRWGEDGLLGWCDRQSRLNFTFAFWNGHDPILKERLYGLNNQEGNHGEDVKEIYYYLDATPTHSYAKALYRYPQSAFPYDRLREENARRGYGDPEFEIIDTGIFDEHRYWNCEIEYAKGAPGDIAIRLTLTNAGPEAAEIHVLPTLWFRNTWDWGRIDEFSKNKPELNKVDGDSVECVHDTLGRHRFTLIGHEAETVEWLFTENMTNLQRLYGATNPSPFVKDAFHRRVIEGDTRAVNPELVGTKVAPWLKLKVPAGGTTRVDLRLTNVEAQHGERERVPFEQIFLDRIAEANEFYGSILTGLQADDARISRQSYAGLLWTKQFYHYIVPDWLEGDPSQPPPAPSHATIRNADWPHFFARDILSMPDKWEYPWFAAWDLAFHMLPMARIDPDFAKAQLLVLLREWYLHPNGQIPAYEWNFGDVNPPVHAWAVWRVYKISEARGHRDLDFLERGFQKLLLNFTWWVNRKDPDGRNIFGGGFLGLDNIGVFDRSKPLPGGGELEQADATAWMGFYCLTMLSMAIELAAERPAYEDIASKFFEHFVAISDASNALDGEGLWDEADGFYYDRWRSGGKTAPMRVRSMVGLLPLIAVEVLNEDRIRDLPGFRNRLDWFLNNRPDLAKHITWCARRECEGHGRLMLLAMPSENRLRRVLERLFDEAEFLSPHGIRSLSKAHAENPFVLQADGEKHCVGYEPGESQSWMFGGNSNWRGPVWFPVNYLLIEALERYDHFYGDTLEVEMPAGSGHHVRLREAAREVGQRLTSIFRPNSTGWRPFMGNHCSKRVKLGWQEELLFHEYFHGDNGAGLGASHQTGWTALVSRVLDKEVRSRSRAS